MKTFRRRMLILLLGAASWAGGAAEVPYSLYWGDVHGHTSASDGKGSAKDYFTHARDVAQLDFVIVTDHDFGNAPPWRMPAEAWRLTQEAADGFTEDGRFVAIAGYEWTSQPKYWAGAGTGSERLFPGPPMHFNHKNVYFPIRIPSILSSKDPAFNAPDLLADAVRIRGGLVHNNHPSFGVEGRDQFLYAASNASIIANTEMLPDRMRYQGTNYLLQGEQTVRAFLDRGGRTGFVGGTDTHEGTPAARTAVLAVELSRSGVFDALRRRRCYAVTHARIVLDFRIDGQAMGGEVNTKGPPKISLDVNGTDRIEEVTLIRDGKPWRTFQPGARTFHFEGADESFSGSGYYYATVVQADTDEHGNRSRAWSSPIWVKREGPGMEDRPSRNVQGSEAGDERTRLP